MLKNKNVKIGFLIFLVTLLSLFLFAENSNNKDAMLSKLEATNSQELLINH